MIATLLLATLSASPPAPPASDAVRPQTGPAAVPSRRDAIVARSLADVAGAMRDALEASLRWHGCGEEAVAQLGAAVESAVVAGDSTRLAESTRRHAAADFSAWLGSPAWRQPPRRPAGEVDSEDLAAAKSVLRWAIARWLEAPPVGEAERAHCIAEEQAMLATLLESIESIAAARRLDESSIARLRRRVSEQAEIRLARRGNPFFPEWAAPRPMGAAALSESLASAIAQDALLRAIAERAAIELRELEGDPRTARFRRLLVDAQIDAAAHRLDELASRALDEADPDAPPRETPPPWPHRGEPREHALASPTEPGRGFDAFVEALLVGAPPAARR